MILLGYQSSNFVVLGIMRGLTGRFLKGLEKFVDRDAARELVVLGRQSAKSNGSNHRYPVLGLGFAFGDSDGYSLCGSWDLGAMLETVV